MEKFFLIILFLSADNLLCQTDRSFLFQPENRLKFGDQLYCEKDYLRAIDEYNGYLNFFSNETLFVKIGLAYYEMKHFEQAFQILSKENLPFKNVNASVFNAINFQKEKYADINQKSVGDNGSELLRIASLKGYEKYYDKNEFLSPFNESLHPELEKLFDYKNEDHQKSPFLSGALSAVIPGAGKFYTGEISDGITALLLTGILSYLAYDNFDAGHNTRAWIFTGLAAYFYAGNIYGSIVSAEKYNVRIKNDFEMSINLFLEENNYFIPHINFCK